MNCRMSPLLRGSLVIWVHCALAVLAAGERLGADDPRMQQVNRAWQLEEQGDFDQAIELLKSLIRESPSFPYAYRELVYAYSRKSDIPAGIRFFDANPSAFAELALGALYGQLLDFEKASKHYAAFLRSTPGVADTYYEFGVSLSQGKASYSKIASALPPATPVRYRDLALASAAYRKRNLTRCASWGWKGLARAKAENDPDAALIFNELLLTCDAASGLIHAQAAVESAVAIGWQRLILETRFAEQPRLPLEAQPEAIDNLSRWCQREAGGSCQPEVDFMRAGYYEQTGDLERAIASALAAKSLEKSNPSLWEQELRLISRIYVHLGDRPHAIEAAEKSFALAGRLGAAGNQALSLRAISALHRSEGDYFTALREELDSVERFQRLNMSWQAGAGLGSVGALYEELGDYHRAIDYFEQSLTSARRSEDPSEVEDSLLELANAALDQGQADRAIALVRQSMRYEDVVRYQPFTARARLLLGGALARKGDYSRAIGWMEQGWRQFHDLGMQPATAECLIAIANCRLRMNQPAAAEEQFSAALRIAERADLVVQAAMAHGGLAELRLRKGELLAALQEFDAALAAVESIQKRIELPDLKASFAQESARLYEGVVQVCMMLDAIHPGEGFDRRAFDYSERGRARAFLDLLAESRADVNAGLTEEQRRRRTQVYRELSKASAALARADSPAERNKLKAAEEAVADWAREVRAENPTYSRVHYPSPLTSAEAQRAAAGAPAVFLVYQLGDRQSVGWLIGGSTFHAVRLPPRATIESAVMLYRNSLSRLPASNISPAKSEEVARKLYAMLITPFGDSLKSKKSWIVVADGTLHYLPFEALAGGTSAHPRYVLDDHVVVYSPSVSSYAKQVREDTPAHGRKQLLAYGDPVFVPAASGGRTQASLARGVYRSTGFRLYPLPNTRIEVNGIATYFLKSDRKVVLGAGANKAAFLNEKLEQYRLIHLATHALLDDMFPSRSGVVLSPQGSEDDGILRVNEVVNLRLSADLVVLSACETGLGRLVRGEGVIGLTRAFLYAGAERVAVSLWEVDDAETAQFMQEFYQEMSLGLGPPEALREAKLHFLHSKSPARRAPYYWAPFVVAGRL